jgi:RNA polymerase sigma factor (sigma-70 family)
VADEPTFDEFIRRVRAGDEAAAEELVKRYGEKVRREAKARTVDPRLRQVFDSVDICQSVLGSFFVRIAAGHYELDSPARLMKLLVVMTRNKVREKARRRHEGELGAREPLAAGEDHANRILNQDFLSEFRRRLSDDERVLWDRRDQDASWQNIASELGATPEALRQQYSRAIHRVARELGLEEGS